jgi:hypothetical protein
MDKKLHGFLNKLIFCIRKDIINKKIYKKTKVLVNEADNLVEHGELRYRSTKKTRKGKVISDYPLLLFAQ